MSLNSRALVQASSRLRAQRDGRLSQCVLLGVENDWVKKNRPDVSRGRSEIRLQKCRSKSSACKRFSFEFLLPFHLEDLLDLGIDRRFEGDRREEGLELIVGERFVRVDDCLLQKHCGFGEHDGKVGMREVAIDRYAIQQGARRERVPLSKFRLNNQA